MEKRDVRQRDAAEAHEHAQEAPPRWADVQDSVAAAAGLSLLLVAGHQPPALAVSNNNSVCLTFQSSPKYRRLCDPYCGAAHARALEAGGPAPYRCHAGLHCVAMPIEITRRRPELAVIGGRAFLTTADYRALAERVRGGDLQGLPSEELFNNVIFASRQDLEELTRRVNDAVLEYEETHGSEGAAEPPRDVKIREDESRGLSANVPAPSAETDTAQEGDGGTLLKLFYGRYFQSDEFKKTCETALKSLGRKHGLATQALMLAGEEGDFIFLCGVGRYKTEPPEIKLSVADARLSAAARAHTSLILREAAGGLTAADEKPRKNTPPHAAELFPLVVGDELRLALVVAAEPSAALDEEKRRLVAKDCREIALSMEVLRLRFELEQRARYAGYLQSFAESLNAVEPAETYRSILRHSAELLRAERGSLLLYDEDSNELSVKATVGPHEQSAGEARMRLGDGVSGSVMEAGRPLVVRDVESAGRTPAPASRRYKTKSFISYPIRLGGRKVGVLNVTDKAGGGAYDDADVRLLDEIAPQMALALDRAEWREKAAQFQLMSITDPLTGLLNRRYLEERLTEELRRSQRHGYPMSFMMIDIDDFKLYNDRNHHQAGDLALEMTAQCLKSTLRAADVASRYGGEEFCILLPQTSLAEAVLIAERIRRRVERTRFPHGKHQPHGAVTASIGVSCFSPDGLNTSAAIIGAADRALYFAKASGKNRVKSHEEVPPDAPRPPYAAEDVP